uniref:Uncharacterized protein n=1 Tax=Manihot esculenta TaxID=3983 RepID=A0A2C9WHW6_MANES
MALAFWLFRFCRQSCFNRYSEGRKKMWKLGMDKVGGLLSALVLIHVHIEHRLA